MSENRESGKKRRRPIQQNPEPDTKDIREETEHPQEPLSEPELVNGIEHERRGGANQEPKAKNHSPALAVFACLELIIIGVLCVSIFMVKKNGWIDDSISLQSLFTTPIPTVEPTSSDCISPSPTMVQNTPTPTASPSKLTSTPESTEHRYVGYSNAYWSDDPQAVSCEVVISEDGRIIEVNVIKCDYYEGFKEYAISTIPDRIVSANSLDIDVKCGATMTANEIVYAVYDALVSGGADVALYLEGYPDKTIAPLYTPTPVPTPAPSPTLIPIQAEEESITVRGHGISAFSNDTVSCDVTVTSSGKIIDITVLSCDDTPGIMDSAITTIPNRIIASNSTDVDVECGATETAQAIVDAVNDALKNAGDFIQSSQKEQSKPDTIQSQFVPEWFTKDLFKNDDNFVVTIDDMEPRGFISVSTDNFNKLWQSDCYIKPDVYINNPDGFMDFPIMRITVYYSAKEWLFADEAIFKIGNRRYTFSDIGDSSNRTVNGSNINERMVILIGKENLKFIEDIYHSDGIIKLRLKGDKTYKDFELKAHTNKIISRMYEIMYNSGGFNDRYLNRISETKMTIQ